jgi:hypothetical protein
MYKKIIGLVILSSLSTVSGISFAQGLPSSSLIVNTVCKMSHGHSIDDIITVARARPLSEEGPNRVFYRTPISGSNFSDDWVLRTVYWDNLSHWAAANSRDRQQSEAQNHLDELITCDNSNRKFFDNYNIGTGNPYNNGKNQVSGIAARFCTLKPGATIAEAYQVLLSNNAQYDGEHETMMQLSHLKHGSMTNVEMGTRITIRLVGKDLIDLAKRLDLSGPRRVGTPDGVMENCSDSNLFMSHVASW